MGKFRKLEINQLWISDITYIRTTEGWLYIAAIMDLLSRTIVGWQLSDSLGKNLVIDAMNKSVIKYGVGKSTVFHSDRGVQFASQEYRELLLKYGFEQSMSSSGNCYNNVPMESFFIKLINELIFGDITS